MSYLTRRKEPSSRLISFFLCFNLPIRAIDSPYTRDVVAGSNFSSHILRKTIISHAAGLKKYLFPVLSQPAYCSLLVDGVTTISHKEHHVYAWFVKEARRVPVFWGEYTSPGPQDAAWLCGVLREIVEDLMKTNRYVVALTSDNAKVISSAVRKFNEENGFGLSLAAPSEVEDAPPTGFFADEPAPIEVPDVDLPEPEERAANQETDDARSSEPEPATKSQVPGSDSSVHEISDIPPATEPTPSNPPHDVMSIQYILHYPCACHSMSLICGRLLTHLDLLTKMDDTVAELRERDAFDRDEHIPTYSPTRWTSTYKRIHFLAKRAERYHLEGLPDLLEGQGLIGLIDKAIKALEKDSATLFTVHKILTDLDLQLQKIGSPDAEYLRTMVNDWKTTHFNKYAVVDAFRFLIPHEVECFSREETPRFIRAIRGLAAKWGVPLPVEELTDYVKGSNPFQDRSKATNAKEAFGWWLSLDMSQNSQDNAAGHGLTDLMCRMATIIPSEARVERYFSQRQLCHTKIRNKAKMELVQASMFLRMHLEEYRSLYP